MRRYLLVALWPAGLAAIAAATVIVARRAPVSPALAAADDPAGLGGTNPAGTAGRAGRDGAELAEVTDTGAGGGDQPAAASAAIQEASRSPSGALAARPDWMPDLIRFGALSCAGGVVSYGVMALLGPPIVKHGPAIDEPIFRWTESHRVNWWAAVMERFNKVGNTWTTWGAAGTAAACLAVSWRKQKWLPPAALGAAIMVDHYATLALRYTFARPGPPGSPNGTYPAGGPDRVILFYGLIAHLLWREFSGSYRGKVWAVGALAALSFNQAYCREYLSKHWFTDIISGLLYGVVLLMPFIAAVRRIAGPAGLEAGRGRPGQAGLAAAMRP
ncbi:MAG TPA: hypothetical protein VK162_10655 [Streptosporangiaceae bacterium]|nr:hypothetical protein [Streptosporangiaceae bacterium]